MTGFNQTCGHLDGPTKETLCRSFNTLYRHMRYGERIVLCSHNSERNFRLVKVKVVTEQEEEEDNLDDNNGHHRLMPPSSQSGSGPLDAFTTLLTSTVGPSLTTSHPVATAQSSSPQLHFHQSHTQPAASTNLTMISVSPHHHPPVSAQSSMLMRSQRPTVPPSSASQPHLPHLQLGISPATTNPISNPESSRQIRRRILPPTFSSAATDPHLLTLSHFFHSHHPPTFPVTATISAFLPPSTLALTIPSGSAFSRPMHPPLEEDNLDDNNGLRHLMPPSSHSGRSPLDVFTTLLTSTVGPSLTTSHPVATVQFSSPQLHLHQSRTQPATSTNPTMFLVSPRHHPPVSAQSSMFLRSQRLTVPPSSASQPHLPHLQLGIIPATTNPISNPESSRQTRRRILPRTFSSAATDPHSLSHFLHSHHTPTSPVTARLFCRHPL